MVQIFRFQVTILFIPKILKNGMVHKLNSFFCVFSGKMTYLGQKFCVVVYPMEDEKKKEESVEEIELKEQSVPLSAEDEHTPKSADC